MVGRDRVAGIIAGESVRRAIMRATADLDNGVVELDVCADCTVDPEELKRMAALNIAMIRLIEASKMN